MADFKTKNIIYVTPQYQTKDNVSTQKTFFSTLNDTCKVPVRIDLASTFLEPLSLINLLNNTPISYNNICIGDLNSFYIKDSKLVTEDMVDKFNNFREISSTIKREIATSKNNITKNKEFMSLFGNSDSAIKIYDVLDGIYNNEEVKNLFEYYFTSGIKLPMEYVNVLVVNENNKDSVIEEYINILNYIMVNNIINALYWLLDNSKDGTTVEYLLNFKGFELKDLESPETIMSKINTFLEELKKNITFDDVYISLIEKVVTDLFIYEKDLVIVDTSTNTENFHVKKEDIESLERLDLYNLKGFNLVNFLFIYLLHNNIIQTSNDDKITDVNAIEVIKNIKSLEDLVKIV